MGLSDMSHGGYKCSDMGHIHFLNLTCDTVENKRQSHATLPFLETDMRHWDPHQGPQVWVPGIVNRCGLVGGGGVLHPYNCQQVLDAERHFLV